MLRMFSEPNDSIENPLSSRVETTLPFCQLSDPIYSRIVGTDPTYLKYSAWESRWNASTTFTFTISYDSSNVAFSFFVPYRGVH